MGDVLPEASFQEVTVPILTTQGLEKSFGPQVLFQGVSVSIHSGQRIGLVGNNGTGKSTLAQILAGIQQADTGTISRRRTSTIEYLAQEPRFPEDRSALDVALDGLTAWRTAKDRHEQVSRDLELGTGGLESLLQEQADAAAAVEHAGGWAVQAQVEATLNALGIKNSAQLVGTMSGGERRRVALARLLTLGPDLAILDEPTNHLDVETIEWLETYLVEQYQGALLLVTHDRYFLDRIAQHTWELDGGSVFRYEGGWEQYLQSKAERQAHVERTESNRQNFLRKELEWLRRQPKARSGKQKARISRAENAVAQGPLRTAENVELAMSSQRTGGTILELADVGVDIAGRTLIDCLTLHLRRGDRVGIVGVNGTGKTSLLKCITQEITPTRGQLKIGKNTVFAYFDQARANLDDKLSILENVAGDRRTLPWAGNEITAFSYLEKFLFFADKIRQPVGSLSGGERARVGLAKMLQGTANVLLLDEPTNDLDTSTLGALEDLLQTFAGAALVVTHDRYFLDRFATSILAFLGDGRVRLYPGNFSAYQATRTQEKLDERRELPSPAAARSSARPEKKPPPSKTSLTPHERRELGGLLDKISAGETNAAELERKLSEPEVYKDKVKMASFREQLNQAQADVVRLMARWEELEKRQA